jgi:hypothetical protein
MKVFLGCLGLVLCSAGRLRAPAADDEITKLKQVVTGSESFQKKVQATCANATKDKDACTADATASLFCQLLSRSKPEMAKKANCTESKPAATAGSFAAVKAKIQNSKEFQEKAESMSVMLGCTGVKKAENCAKYVNEAAFCLAFADKMASFKGMDGEKEEENYCEHIDDKMPALAMLLQKAKHGFPAAKKNPSFVQVSVHKKAPEDELAKEMTHDLEMNFNKIAPFGKEDTAKELQDHAAKTQDTLVDAVENAEVAEIKRAVFRALTRLRAATIKEFDTIARLETQAIDAYNDAHHYRAENPLTHLHEDEAPVETDKLKSFH